MIQKFENYRYEGDLHRAALRQLPHVSPLSVKEKGEIAAAYKYGWWLSVGIQFPVVLGASILFKRFTPGLKYDQKIFAWSTSFGLYAVFYMFTKAWAWHQAYYKVEPMIKNFILTADIEDIKKIKQEQELQITKDKNIYVPKNDT